MIPVVAALLTVALSALAPSAAVAQWQDTPAVKALYERAKKEGQVAFWGTQEREVAWVPQAFAAMFPGIEVKVLGDNEIATKAIAEARAGRHEVDVFWHGYTGLLTLIERDLLAKVDWAPFGVSGNNVAFEGRGGFTNTIVYSVAYNKDKVKPADVPKKWTDILDPRYKGKMTASLFLLPRLIGSLGMAWGEDKALQFARDIVGKTDILLTRAPRESLLQSGERLYAIGEVESQVQLWAREGNPVKFVIPDPAIAVPFGVSVLAKAPHPNAALLLAGWIASQDGKRQREKAVFSLDYRPGSDNELARQLHATGTQVIVDDPAMVAKRNEITRKAAPILSGQAR